MFTFSPLASSAMNPSFLNLFMKKLTRGRVVPTISARISWDTLGSAGRGPSFLPYCASSKSILARRFSVELKSWSIRSSSRKIAFGIPNSRSVAAFPSDLCHVATTVATGCRYSRAGRLEPRHSSLRCRTQFAAVTFWTSRARHPNHAGASFRGGRAGALTSRATRERLDVATIIAGECLAASLLAALVRTRGAAWFQRSHTGGQP